MTDTQTIASTLLARLAGLRPDDTHWPILQQRGKIVAGVQNCHDLFFADDANASLSLRERLFAALIASQQAGIATLAESYADALRAYPGSDAALQLAQGQDADSVGQPRLKAIDAFVRSVSADPGSASPAALRALEQAGLDNAAIVLLAQLTGYVSFQARLLAGWQAWRTLPADPDASAPADADAFIHPANLPAPGQALRINGFTSETLDWKAWLPVLDPAQATDVQTAILDASHPKARSSDFYLLLALQPAVLRERSAIFNAIMYAPGGLPRAERELATAAVSRVNRCVYCLSVHAQRFEQLAKRNDVIAQLFADPHTTGTNARERAIVQTAITLTESPDSLSAASLAPLQAAGLTTTEILDVIHASALFAWANRLMLNLGEAVHPQPPTP